MADNLSSFQTLRCSVCGHNLGTAMGTDYYPFSPSENNAIFFCETCGRHQNFRRPEEGMSLSDGDFEESQTRPPLTAEAAITDGSTPLPDDFFDEDINFWNLQGSQPPPPSQSPLPPGAEASGATSKSKKIKFTDEHRAEMLEFAESTGWRVTKNEEAGIEELCQRIGILPGSYKHWVKNHKPAERKRG